MDSQMLAGCSSFVFVAIGGYLLSVWPFVVWPSVEKLSHLALDSGLGFGGATILGIIGCKKAKLAGGCGYIGGAMTLAVFLFLRLQQIFVAAKVNQIPPPDYPEWYRTALPVGVVVIALCIAAIVLPKSELDIQQGGYTSEG